MANRNSIPTVDLSTFFTFTEGNEDGKKKAMELISEASKEYGFFQIVNHGVPHELMSKALELSRTFFGQSSEEKLKYSPIGGGPVPAGYKIQPEKSTDKMEYLLLLPPGSKSNVYPQHPPGFKEFLEELFSHLVKLGLLLESIFNDCLGLPPNFLKKYNNDRSWDFLSALHYFPATESENMGLSEHQDQNVFTFVFQDDAGGLQVNINDEWIPINPSPSSIVVNVGDILQVWSNNKLKSNAHRVLRAPQGRYSFSFFYNVHGDKWVEPFPQFAQEIGVPPEYQGFLYKDYQSRRLRDMTHPPPKRQAFVRIADYQVTTAQ